MVNRECMFVKIIKVAMASCVLSLWGCAQPLPDISSVDTNNLTKEQSVLIVTAGASETCISFSSAFVLKEHSKKPNMSDSIAVFQLNNDFVESNFEDEYGIVYTTILKPGEYDLWLYAQNPYFTFEDPTLIKPFTLDAGEVKYIGEVYANGCKSMLISVNDKSLRDLPLVKSFVPDLDLNKVKIEPVEIILTIDKN